ncbi:PAS domain-containing sensor histidine kinase [Pseudomonadota bacterium]
MGVGGGKSAMVYAGNALVTCLTVALVWVYVQNTKHNIVDVQRGWVVYEQEATQRTVLLSELHSVIGYGGFIHNFKNYILRSSDSYRDRVEHDRQRIKETISNFRDLPLTDKEVAAVSRVEATLNNYFAKFETAKAAVADGRASGDIDALVKVDDAAALQALDELTQVVVEKGNLHRKTTGAAIQDTIDTVLYGAALIPLVILSSLLFASAFWRSQSAQSDATSAREQLNAVIEANPDTIIVSDERGRITQTNSEIEKLLGYSREEIIGQAIEDLIPQNLRERHSNIRKTYFSERRHHLTGNMSMITAQRKNGSVIPVDIALGDFKIKGISYTVASIRDMTEHREIENQLRDAKDKAETFAKAKSEFLANMSHELRTPLNAIIGFSEALLSKTFGPFSNDRHEEYTTYVHNSGSHLLNIINDILDMSKVDAGKLDLYEEDVNIAEMVDTCFKMVEPRARNAGVLMTNNVVEQSIVLWADSTRMRQMLLNLLSNAVKFTDENGTVTMDACILEDGTCALSVADQGIGMNAEAIQVALEPFGQVENSMTRQQEGTGLGLPLTKSLAELHGGMLILESEEGIGTTATIHMPAERACNARSIN